MKRIFRNLALVLVLVMAVTVMPMYKASAAKKPTLAKKKVTLFVKQGNATKYASQGYVGDSYKSAKKISKTKAYYKLNIKNLPKKAKITVTNNNKKVATYNKNNKKITAKAAGKAVFTVKVNGKKIGTLTATVKSNAKTVEITNLPSDNIIGMEGMKLTATSKDSKGNKPTDLIGYKITSGSDVASVDNNGTLKIAKPGSFKVMVYTYQSASFPGIIASKEYDLTAEVKLVKLSAVSDKVYNLTFDADMKDLFKKDDAKIYYLAGKTPMTVQTKSIELDSKDSKKIVVELWNKLDEAKEYFVDINGKTYKLPGVNTNPEDVASIEITTTEVEENVLTDIEYKLYNKDGVLIAPYPTASVTITSTDINCSIVNNQIIIFGKGKSVEVNAVYSYSYLAPNGQWTEIKIPGKATVKSVGKAPVTKVKSTWKINNTFDYDYDSDFIAVGDNYMFINYELETSDKKVYTHKTGDGLKFVSSDPSTLMTNTGSVNSLLVPIKTGTVSILVYLPGEDEPIDTIKLEVKPERYVADLSVRTDNDKTTINVLKQSVLGINDYVSIRLLAKDQYGEPIETNVNISAIGGTLKDLFPITTILVMGNHEELTHIYGNSFGTTSTDDGKEGTLVLKYETENGKGVKTLTLNTKIVTPPANDNGIKYVVDYSTDQIDTTIFEDNSNNPEDFEITLYCSKYYNGYQVSGTSDIKYTTSRNFTAEGFYYDISYNGSVINVPDATDSSFYVLSKDASGEIKKLKPGQYTITVFNVTKQGSNYIPQPIDTKVITIKDNQSKLTYTQNSNKFNGTWDESEFTVYYNGIKVLKPANLTFDAIDGGSNIVLKSITYKLETKPYFSHDFFENAFINLTVEVNQVLEK